MREINQQHEQHRSRKWLAGLGIGMIALLPACGSKTETVQYDLQVDCPKDTEIQVTDIVVNGVGGGFTLSCDAEAPDSVSVVDGPDDKEYPTIVADQNSRIVEVVFEDYSDNFTGGEATISTISTRENGTRVVIRDMEDFERIQQVG